MAAIAHRGPDEEGLLQANNACVGMRRLSIIDLKGGSQPVWNETKTVAVIYNGEIYNFHSLRQDLERAGHRFQTLSDTEVIVHGYEEWGEHCLKQFHGMFAFALLEMPHGPKGAVARVFLARDPLGIKPLYYTVVDGALFFGSEVRALLASGLVPRSLSREALCSYLLFGSAGEPMSPVEGVFSLPPGHFLSISATRPLSGFEPKSYWQIQSPGTAESGRRVEAKSSPARRVRALLENAVHTHLVADVPIGIFLSSGLDSTAIAALAAQSQQGIHTFTVAFPDIEFSEAATARRTATRLRTEHTELTLTAQEMAARLDEAIAAFDQPSMDGVNTYFVSWAARQAGLKVALSGLGSDELFGGYTSFRTVSRVAGLLRGGRLVPRAVRGWAAKVIEGSTLAGASPDASQKALAAWLDPASLPDEYFFTRALFTAPKVSAALGENASAWVDSCWWKWLSDAVSESRRMDRFTKISWLESRSYLVNTLLRDTDAMSMHHSLEVRVPFLDLPLVEYIFSLPQASKESRGQPKSLLIAALADLLPEEITSQRKRTFTFPWDNWLRGTLGQRVAKGLEQWSPALEPHLKKEFASGIWRDFLNGRTSWSRPWSLYVLNEWVKHHISSGNICHSAVVSNITTSAASETRVEIQVQETNSEN